MNARCLIRLAALALGFTAGAAPAADQVLFDFTRGFDASRIAGTDARVLPQQAPAGAELRVATGHAQPWPGITLPAPGGQWNLSPYDAVTLTLRNPGTNPVTVFCRVDNPGADGTDHCVTHSLALMPGQRGSLAVTLKRASDDTLGDRLFGMRGYPVSLGGPGTVNPAQITQLVVFVSKPAADHIFEIEEIRATGTYHPPTAWVTDANPFFPFIDTFGQYRHKDWPGKVKSLADLKSRRAAEAEELARLPGPKNWDEYGGWAGGPHLEATGFFRTQKVNGKWWLVDPDGRLFFSYGIDCVGTLDATPIDERATWFDDFPGDQPELASFRSLGYPIKGYYADSRVASFSFSGANLRRKYGPDWDEVYPRLIHQRLRSWGLNTIGNWSDAGTCHLRLTPYTDSIDSGRAIRIAATGGYWGKFPDVFDPDFLDSLRRAMAAKQRDSAGDPWCIGYFCDNEMSWGNDTSLARGALQSPSGQPAKEQLVADLQAKYVAIEKLNQAWGAQYRTWSALLQSREAPETPKANDDLAAFSTHVAEQYFRTVRQVIKALAPHQLYLGCRFAWVNPRVAAAAAKYCDVVSYNLYQRNVAGFKFDGGADVPLIIGEFHFGALDRGLFHPGLVPVATQQARAQAYKEYVLSVLHHPQFVGCHWFQYSDEPTTGRVYDEENYQIGFVDVADTPYAETVAASREIGDELYRGR